MKATGQGIAYSGKDEPRYSSCAFPGFCELSDGTLIASFKGAERKMVTLTGINNINQSIGGILQSTANNLAAIQNAEATRQGAESKREEEMLDQTKDLFQQEQTLINQIVQLFSAVIQAENQSMRDAIQA